MSAEVLAAWIAAAAAVGSAGVAWFAQRGAARTAERADKTVALVEAKTGIYNADRAIYVERVTAERAQWRRELRACTAELVGLVDAGEGTRSKLRELRAEIVLRLNPKGGSATRQDRDEHPLDAAVFAALASISSEGDRSRCATQLETAVAALIKNEWDKSKREARPTDMGQQQIG